MLAKIRKSLLLVDFQFEPLDSFEAEMPSGIQTFTHSHTFILLNSHCLL